MKPPPLCQVDDMDGAKRTILTDTSNKPTGRDANFLQVKFGGGAPSTRNSPRGEKGDQRS